MSKRSYSPSLYEKYPPSPPCECDICKSYCRRPGWWTVEQARRAAASGYAGRMMLELSPDRSFGVLSPAFRGCEGYFAVREYSRNGCCFLHNGLCELHGTSLLPLECGFCHHSRQGRGQRCHNELERDWKSAEGRVLVSRWIEYVGLGTKTGDIIS